MNANTALSDPVTPSGHAPAVVAPGAGGCPVAAPAETDAATAGTLYYWDYLHLDYLLSAQNPKSAEAGHPQHDEHLFICVHQTAELWFKQILVELDAVMAVMGLPVVDERDLGTALARLERINQIVKLLTVHLDVLETMTPLDFMDFRGFLMPASGFQSVQFRLIENRFGLLAEDGERRRGA